MDMHDDGPPGGDGQDDGLIHLEDLSFDFEDYFKRADAEELSQQESIEFPARVIGRYCRDIYARKLPPVWVLDYVAEAFSKVLAGGEWDDELPMPWTVPNTSHFPSRSMLESIEIIAEISRLMQENPEVRVTSAITAAATAHNVSYEKARAVWYKHNRPKKAF